MNIAELTNLAEQRIAEHPTAAVDGVEDRLMLSMPEPKKHNGYRVRLFGRRGPYAEIINGKMGRLLVCVSARRVRDYINGYVVKSELE